MIAKVKSVDGTILYVSVKAKNRLQLDLSRGQLEEVAAKRTTNELLADGYTRTPEDLFL